MKVSIYGVPGQEYSTAARVHFGEEVVLHPPAGAMGLEFRECSESECWTKVAGEVARVPRALKVYGCGRYEGEVKQRGNADQGLPWVFDLHDADSIRLRRWLTTLYGWTATTLENQT